MTSGTLTNKAEIDGTIDAEDGISITLPEGPRVIKVNAERGKQVSEGEALLAFDVSSIKDKIKGLEDEIYILNQKISLSGKGSSDSVLDAQQALDDAQQAYDRLVAKLERNDFADPNRRLPMQSKIKTGPSQLQGRHTLRKRRKIGRMFKNLGMMRFARHSKSSQRLRRERLPTIAPFKILKLSRRAGTTQFLRPMRHFLRQKTVQIFQMRLRLWMLRLLLKLQRAR